MSDTPKMDEAADCCGKCGLTFVLKDDADQLERDLAEEKQEHHASMEYLRQATEKLEKCEAHIAALLCWADAVYEAGSAGIDKVVCAQYVHRTAAQERDAARQLLDDAYDGQPVCE